jgi:hypothetical protein
MELFELKHFKLKELCIHISCMIYFGYDFNKQQNNGTSPYFLATV